MSATLPPSFVEPGVKGRWIFDADVACTLLALIKAIEEVNADNETYTVFFRVVLGGMLTDVSNVVISGKGRRYRRGWQNRELTGEEVSALFAERVDAAIQDVIAFTNRPRPASSVILGDARTQRYSTLYDLAVFSPPYPNSFDYTDVYNVQLWMLGYLDSSASNISLRRDTLASHVQISRTFSAAPEGSSALTRVVNNLESERASLWNKHLPAMVGGYFCDLLRVSESVLSSLREGGECWMVVGDSKYGSTQIPVARVIQELLQSRGYRVYSAEPIRHMKTSAQQGFKSSLAESLLKVRR